MISYNMIFQRTVIRRGHLTLRSSIKVMVPGVRNFNSSHDKPPDLHKTLLNNLMQKDKSENVSSELRKEGSQDRDDAEGKINVNKEPVKRPTGELNYIVNVVSLYFGMWVFTCGSFYTAVKTNSIDTAALLGIERSYAVDHMVSSIEKYTRYRLSPEQIVNPNINEALLSLALTKLTAPFRLVMTFLIARHPQSK